MTNNAPDHPKIFHITHLDNLPSIVQEGVLWSDSKRIERQIGCQLVGMSSIKERRLHLPVSCHRGTAVGDYVPFYFCPRSVMLYLLHKGNHVEINYRGGQQPIVHLVADLHAVVEWADAQQRRWAFSNRNAGTYYADFFNDLADLGRINWDAVGATDFSNPLVKDGKQAEFLVQESSPWSLIEAIGVFDQTSVQRVRALLRGVAHQPVIRVEKSWYF